MFIGSNSQSSSPKDQDKAKKTTVVDSSKSSSDKEEDASKSLEEVEQDDEVTGPEDKREYRQWSPEENALFFSSLKSSTKTNGNGQLVDFITKKIATKTKEQVRQYYYRMVQKTNTFLKPLGHVVEIKQQEEARKALLAYHKLISNDKHPPQLQKEVSHEQCCFLLLFIFLATMTDFLAGLPQAIRAAVAEIGHPRH